MSPEDREIVDRIKDGRAYIMLALPGGRSVSERQQNAVRVALGELRAERRALRQLCAEAAQHLRTLPIQSDYKDGEMAAKLEEAARG